MERLPGPVVNNNEVQSFTVLHFTIVAPLEIMKKRKPYISSNNSVHKVSTRVISALSENVLMPHKKKVDVKSLQSLQNNPERVEAGDQCCHRRS